jgi:hypothetical protein
VVIPMSGYYLGVLTGIEFRGSRRAAELRPVCVASEDERSWEPLLDDSSRETLFPNRGLVSWLDPPDSAKKESVWEFGVCPQRSYDEDPHHPRRDKYRVLDDVSEAVEVLDLSQLSVEEARELLTGRGIELSSSLSRKCFVRLADDLWFEPPRFVQKEGCSLWLIDLGATEPPLRCQQWTGEGSIVTLPMEQRRKFLAPRARPHGPVHLIDWCSEVTLLKRVLRLLRKLDQDYARTHGLVERHIEHLTESLVQSAGEISDLELERARIDRARMILQTHPDPDEVARFANVLSQTEPIRDQIERLKREVWDQEREQACSRLQAELAAEREELARAAAQVAALQRSRDELAERIEVLRAEQCALVDRLDERLNERLREILARPEQLLADVTLIRTVANMLDGSNPASLDVPGVPAFSDDASGYKDAAPATMLADAKVLPDLLSHALQIHDAPCSLARPLHASLLSGAMPVLVGSFAGPALEAYASCISGGRIHWIPISATMIEPYDLLGRFDPVSDRFIPHPAGLIPVLWNAYRSDGLHIVVLEGIDRAPIDGYLLSLLACYGDAWRVVGGRTLSCVHPSRPGVDGPSVCRLGWPKNLLLAGTVSTSAISLGLPRDLWRYATLILCDHLGFAGGNAESEQHPDRRQSQADLRSALVVPLTAWTEWREVCQEQDLIPVRGLWEKAEREFRLRRDCRDLSLRFFAADRTWPVDIAPAVGDTFAYCLAPQLAHEAQAAAALFRALPTPYGDLLDALTAISPLLA